MIHFLRAHWVITLALLWGTPHGLWGRSGGPAAQRASYNRVEKTLQEAEHYLRGVMENPQEQIPEEILRKASGMIIYPRQIKVGFLLGVEGGASVGLCRLPDGSWSLPVLGREGGLSLGLQIGAKQEASLILLMDDASLALLESGRMKSGIDLGVAVGPVGSGKDFNLAGGASVLVYPSAHKTRGFHAGVAFKTNALRPTPRDNRLLYGTSDPRAILSEGISQMQRNRYPLGRSASRKSGGAVSLKNPPEAAQSLVRYLNTVGRSSQSKASRGHLSSGEFI